MSVRTLHSIVWTLAVLSAGLAIAAGLLTFVGGAQVAAADVTDLIGGVLFGTSPIVGSVIGLLIVMRQPRNPVGWLFCGLALSIAVENFVQAYAIYGLLAHPGTVPGGVVAAVLGNALWPGNWPFLLLLLLLFPNGRLVSPRWRPVGWLAVAFPAGLIFLSAVYPGPLYPFEGRTNPIGLSGPAGDLVRQIDVSAIFKVILVLFLVAVVSLVVRFRRATGDERQQLKWLAYAGVLGVISQVAALGLPRTLGNLVTSLALYGIPVAIGVAMLRYRLYDIDLIIRRTLVYAALTAFLSAVYFGGVVLLQQIIRGVTGQQSDLAIVGSTLAIAALFQPLRQWIQRLIDRRFNRRKYDGARVFASFSATVRDEVDLGQLTDRLLAVVEETMQPVHASLWLPGPVPAIRTSGTTGQPDGTSSERDR